MSGSRNRRAVDHLDLDWQPTVERLDAGFAYRGGGIAVPSARPVDVDSGMHGVDPALELGVVGLSEPLPEPGGDVAAPMAGCTLANQPDIESDHGTALFGHDLGAHLIGHPGRDEQFDVHVLAGRGAHDRD